MYKVRDKVYADAGKILIGNNKIGYIFQGELSEFSEEDIILDDMKIVGNYISYSNGRVFESYDRNATYESLKTKYIKRYFSNDDQIAIMLNKEDSEEDSMLFIKMQQYREWCSILAKKVLSL